jgi:hypothetical protein
MKVFLIFNKGIHDSLFVPTAFQTREAAEEFLKELIYLPQFVEIREVDLVCM